MYQNGFICNYYLHLKNVILHDISKIVELYKLHLLYIYLNKAIYTTFICNRFSYLGCLRNVTL